MATPPPCSCLLPLASASYSRRRDKYFMTQDNPSPDEPPALAIPVPNAYSASLQKPEYPVDYELEQKFSSPPLNSPTEYSDRWERPQHWCRANVPSGQRWSRRTNKPDDAITFSFDDFETAT